MSLLKLSGKEKIHIVNFMKIWTHYDKNQNGYLDREEVDVFIKDWIKAQGTEYSPQRFQAEKQRLYHDYDVNKDGRLELSEVARLLPIEENFLAKYPGRQALSRDDFNTIFKHYDKDGSGRVGKEELLALLRDLFMKHNQAMTLTDLENYAKSLLEIYESDDGKLSRDQIGVIVAKSI